MSVRESVFRIKMGKKLLDPVVAIDRKAVNCGSHRSVVALQCQVAFPRWGEIAHR